MRNEEEMLALIVGYAEKNDRVRAVIMNGSRLNKNAPRDCFQDYDIVYVVTEVDSFVRERDWIQQFGEMMIMQMPEEMGSELRESYDFFNFLMQFKDGNRIDLNLYTAERFNQVERDSLSLLLLDKDGRIDPFPPPSDTDYITVRPSAKQFANCCNEFWWVSTYIVKGLWRGEVLYAKQMLEQPVRDMLIKMLRWHVGIRSGFTVDSGKYGKYFEKQLTPEQWDQLMSTYRGANYDHIWKALFNMVDLFRQTALEVAAHLGYEYPHDDDRRVTAHLVHVRDLPQDAEQMYP